MVRGESTKSSIGRLRSEAFVRRITASSLAALILILGQLAVAQSTVSVNVSSAPNCTSAMSCGPTTVQANQFAANGNGAGGLNMAAGSAPSQPGVGILANSIMFYAPTAVQTPYAIALTPAPSTSTPPSSGFWYGTLGPAVSFSGVTCCGSNGQITALPSISPTGSGYLVPPPCYFANGGTVSTTIPARPAPSR